MTKNILNAALVLLGAGSLLTGCDFEQPAAPCFVQDSTAWYAKYDPVDEPRDANGAACAIVAPLGERIGVYKFTDPDDLSKSLLTIRPNGTASLGARDSGNPQQQTAVGSLAVEPDANDFCAATGFSTASVNAAATASAPAVTVSYEFSNVRVYSAAQAPGTQLTGELKYTRNGCTSTYVVRAMWPAEPCIVGANKETDPADACGNGSGLNPDFDAECMALPTPNCGSLDPATYTGCCVPKKAIPSFITSAE
jgi:hypothetical protein